MENIGQLFIKATREDMKFESKHGLLTLSSLWKLKLSELDDIYAFYAMKRKHNYSEDVSLIKNKDETLLKEEIEISEKMAIVKYIFDTLTNEANERKNERERSAKKQMLLELLKKKENEKYESMTAEQLQKEIESL